ncbi:MAG: nucleotide exchange factor GrpE [Thermoplasmata archaeon]
MKNVLEMGVNMEQDKDTYEANKKSKEKGTLAEKESEISKTPLKDPLMTIGSRNTTNEAKLEHTKIEEKTPEGVKELDIEKLKSSLEEKNKLAEMYYDRLLRTQAEFENYKKRTEKESNEFKIYANAQLVKDLLGVIDDFQNALSSEIKGSDEKFMEGIELIFENFYGMLEKEGLSMINPVNEKFDPWKHEVVEMVPTYEHPEHTVLGVVQPGYKFKDKILRPAKVRVSTVPASEEEKSEDEGVKDEKGKFEGEDTDKNIEKKD